MPDKKDNNIAPIVGTFEEVVGSIVPKVNAPAPLNILSSDNFEVVQYMLPLEEDPIDFTFDADGQNIWATQQQIANLFQSDRSNITKHINNIFQEGELDETSNVQLLHIARSTKPVKMYSLDTIISVGYKVNSKAATEFRKWATQTLKAYVEQGYVINEKALRESPEKLNKLASQLRALRSEEKQVYAKVRECFKISASDYDPSSRQIGTFYALLQEKFYHAVTGSNTSKIIMDRANHLDENMGVQSFNSNAPTIAEATVGKNYLDKDELYRLHLLSEQFLLYAESTALQGKKMTMDSLHKQLDRLLTLNEYPIFEGWRDYIKDAAIKHARIEHGLYKKRLKIEKMGIEYDEEALASGEYDDILIAG